MFVNHQALVITVQSNCWCNAPNDLLCHCSGIWFHIIISSYFSKQMYWYLEVIMDKYKNDVHSSNQNDHMRNISHQSGEHQMFFLSQNFDNMCLLPLTVPIGRSQNVWQAAK